MGIYNKINQIRQKPEKTRIKYVWILTSISMLIVLLIWALTIKVQYFEKPAPLSESQKSVLEQFDQQDKSLEKTVEEMKDEYEKVSREQTSE